MIVLILCYLIITSNSISNTSKEYLNLINWIEENNGYISKKVKPIEISKSNRMMKSSEKIEKNELIAFIPEKVVISSINKRVNPYCRKAYGLDHEQYLDCIALYLTFDINDPNSFFRPYYDYLPDFDIKIFPSEFSKEEQKLYESLDLHYHIGIHDYKLKNAYNEFVEKILLDKKVKNSYEEFKYYFYLAHTRDFSCPNSQYYSGINSIVPFMDLFNHDNNYNLDWDYSDKKRGFIMKSIKNIEKDEYLSTTYGDLDNIELFTVYGFTLENNRFKTLIRITIDKYNYSLYPSEDENEMKKNINNIINNLKVRYGSDKNKEMFIYSLFLNGLNEKYKIINLIKKDNVNIRNIIEEEKISLSKYIFLLEKYFINNNNFI